MFPIDPWRNPDDLAIFAEEIVPDIQAANVRSSRPARPLPPKPKRKSRIPFAWLFGK